MKQYDKIFIPDEEQGIFLITKERMEDSAPVHVTYASKEESVIVLTLEELKEVCVAMVKEWVDAVEGGLTIEQETEYDLKTYLASKGIQLNPQQ